MENLKIIIPDVLNQLPSIDCGGCGFRTCEEFAHFIPSHPEELKRCIHLKSGKEKEQHPSARHRLQPPVMERPEWTDSLQRPYDFILDCFENEPGPRETILPYNPLLVKELEVKKGNVMVGRPMGMSCGCPITHCGIVTDTDARNGIIHWCVTGPLKPRNEGFIDIGFYTAQAYEGLIRETREEIRIGRRYWFMPRRCMLQWRHSGLINAVVRMKENSYKVRIEGLFIG